MKVINKKVDAVVGVELTLEEVLEMLDGWDFDDPDNEDDIIYTFSVSEDTIEVVGGKKASLKSIKVRLTKEDN